MEIWDGTKDTFVRSIAVGGRFPFFELSPNATLLATNSHLDYPREETLEIWKVNMGVCMGRINPPTTFTWTSFSESGRTLYTSEGNVDLDSSAPLKLTAAEESRAEPRGYHVNGTEPWVMKGSTRVLWLPRDYRTPFVAVRNSKVALVLAEHAVVILRFA